MCFIYDVLISIITLHFRKLKLYEEQELTMQVFCEPENNQLPHQPGMERRDSVDMSVVRNNYKIVYLQ